MSGPVPPPISHKSFPRQPNMSVGDFLSRNRRDLTEGPGCSETGLCRLIDKKRLQKLGMALVGFTEYLQPGRVYVFGNTEWRYFHGQTSENQAKTLDALDPSAMAAIVVSQSLPVPAELAAFAVRHHVPTFQTHLDSSATMYRLTEFLERELSPRTQIHGGLVEVYGMGILILGESSVGKSECALELLLRGHRLVADDLLEIRNVGGRYLSGRCLPNIPHVLELRGIGIVDVRAMFGITAIRRAARIRLVIRLERWSAERTYDRLGMDIQKEKLFGVDIPVMTIPVAPGRNLGALVEVACRVFLMRTHGINPMGRFSNVLKNIENRQLDGGSP